MQALQYLWRWTVLLLAHHGNKGRLICPSTEILPSQIATQAILNFKIGTKVKY